MGVTTQKYGISVTLWPKLAIYGKIRCFQATWVTFEVQSDSDDVKLDYHWPRGYRNQQRVLQTYGPLDQL
jgi:hypothetical protein